MPAPGSNHDSADEGSVFAGLVTACLHRFLAQNDRPAPPAAALTALATVWGLAAQAQSATYTLEPTHTTVFFEAKHFGTSTNRGRFDRKSGTVQFDKAAKSVKVDISIDMASINTGTEAFNKHLSSKDFFKARSTSVAFSNWRST